MLNRSRLDDDWQERTHHSVRKRHGQAMIDRLTLLLNAGYRIDLRHMHEGLGIALRHPNKKAPPLELYGDGHVNDQWPRSETPDQERNLYEPQDKEGFDRFVRRVPKPSLFERFKERSVEEAFYVILAWTLFLGYLAVANTVGNSIWQWIKTTLS